MTIGLTGFLDKSILDFILPSILRTQDKIEVIKAAVKEIVDDEKAVVKIWSKE